MRAQRGHPSDSVDPEHVVTGDNIVEFRLYVVGGLPNSRRAIANLRAYCDENLPERHRIEVLDVFEAPKRALADNIMLTPQLVVVYAGRAQYIVGDLSETWAIRQAHDGIDS